MRTYLAALSNGRCVTCLAVNVWQAVAVILSRHAGVTIDFIETI